MIRGVFHRREPNVIEMVIDSIRVSMMNYQHVVILREKESDRYLPIWIGPAEADAISVKLQNMDMARPLTHDLLRNAISALESASGTSVSRIVVNDLRSDTFYAQIVFEFDEGPLPAAVKFPTADGSNDPEVDKDAALSISWQGDNQQVRVVSKWEESSRKFLEIENPDGLLFELCYDEANSRWLVTRMKLDSRPSDAIALAVRVTAPIFADASVLDKAGIRLDRETGKPIPQERPGAEGVVDEQEMQKLSAFYDFINTLDLDDLGKHKS